MNFFGTLFSICSGTSAFPVLMKRNPFRALFHLLVLAFLLAVLTTGVKTLEVKRLNREIFVELEKQFSSLKISPDGVLPEKNASGEKSFILPYDGTRLDFIPSLPGKKLGDLDSMAESTGILWMPKGFAVWQRVPETKDKYILVHLPLPRLVRVHAGKGPSVNLTLMLAEPDLISYRQLSADELKDYVEKKYFMRPGEKLPIAETERVPMAETEGRVLSIFITIFFFFSALLPFFSTVFLTTLLFACVQHFLPGGRANNPKMTFGNVYTTMIYAAFPGLIAGAAFGIFVPEIISFSTVFFIVFFIYHLFAFGTIRRVLYPNPPKAPDDEDF